MDPFSLIIINLIDFLYRKIFNLTSKIFLNKILNNCFKEYKRISVNYLQLVDLFIIYLCSVNMMCHKDQKYLNMIKIIKKLSNKMKIY